MKYVQVCEARCHDATRNFVAVSQSYIQLPSGFRCVQLYAGPGTSHAVVLSQTCHTVQLQDFDRLNAHHTANGLAWQLLQKQEKPQQVYNKGLNQLLTCGSRLCISFACLARISCEVRHCVLLPSP